MNEILGKLRTAYNRLDYDQFCHKAGFKPSEYALNKFTQFKRGIESLLSFDEETLSNILED
ncbi:MAG: hypothetical protein ACKN9E_09980 [Microcystaceae cyanobacterium]